MTKINLAEFAHYSGADIFTFLLISSDTEFEIIIKRDFAYNQEWDNSMVVDEFFSMAYGGNLLSFIADSFAYTVPDPATLQPFRFQVKTKNYSQLANILSIIIAGYLDIDSDIFVSFKEDATTFWTEAFEDKIPCSTWGLLYIANDLCDE